MVLSASGKRSMGTTTMDMITSWLRCSETKETSSTKWLLNISEETARWRSRTGSTKWKKRSDWDLRCSSSPSRKNSGRSITSSVHYWKSKPFLSWFDSNEVKFFEFILYIAISWKVILWNIDKIGKRLREWIIRAWSRKGKSLSRDFWRQWLCRLSIKDSHLLHYLLQFVVLITLRSTQYRLTQ